MRIKIRIKTFPDYPFASFISVAGTYIALLGWIPFLMLTDVLSPGWIIFLIVLIETLGIASAPLAERIVRNEEKKLAFNRWLRQVRAAGLEPKIRDSVDIALKVYATNPGKRAAKYLCELNPDIVNYLK